MKTGPSSLNPNAASYVPILKRGGTDVSSENDGVRFGHPPDNTLSPRQHPNISQSHVHSPGAMRAAEFATWKDHSGGGFHASTSQYPNQKSYFDDFDMDLAYLQMTFPEISQESLSDVYLANICDIDASLDMLHELEIKLPDTLDIGDVPESGSTSKLDTQRVKSPTSKAGASTSH